MFEDVAHPFKYLKSIDELLKYAAYTLQGLRKDYASLSDEDYFNILISDPTLYKEIQNFKSWEEIDKAGIKKVGSYTIWLLKNNQSTLQFDPEEIRDYLTKFDILRENERIEVEKNIDKYKDFDSLKNTIDEVTQKHKIIKSPAKLKRDVARFSIKDELGKSFEVIYDSPQYSIIKPLTVEASCFFGKGTQWCTATTTPESNRFHLYHDPEKEESGLYIITDKQHNQKWQYAPESHEFMDKFNNFTLQSLMSLEFKKSGDDKINKVLYDLTGLDVYLENDEKELYRISVREAKASIERMKEYYNNPPSNILENFNQNSLELFVSSWVEYNKTIRDNLLYLYDVIFKDVPEEYIVNSSIVKEFDITANYIESSGIYPDISIIHKTFGSSIADEYIHDKKIVNSFLKLNKNNTLIYAVQINDIELIKFLIEKGFNVNTHTEKPPIYFAKTIEILNLLLNNGANIQDVNISDFIDDTETVKYLIEKGLDINTLTQQGNPIVSLATQRGNFELLIFLVKNGADLNITDNSGNAPINEVISRGYFYSSTEKLQLIKYLVEHGAIVNIPSSYLLFDSIYDIELVEYLINAGEDIYKTSPRHQGHNILTEAAYRDNIELIKLLIEKGMNIDTPDSNESTALTYSTYSNNTKTMEFLLENGANINLLDNFGREMLNKKLQQKQSDQSFSGVKNIEELTQADEEEHGE